MSSSLQVLTVIGLHLGFFPFLPFFFFSGKSKKTGMLLEREYIFCSCFSLDFIPIFF